MMFEDAKDLAVGDPVSNQVALLVHAGADVIFGYDGQALARCLSADIAAQLTTAINSRASKEVSHTTNGGGGTGGAALTSVAGIPGPGNIFEERIPKPQAVVVGAVAWT